MPVAPYNVMSISITAPGVLTIEGGPECIKIYALVTHGKRNQDSLQKRAFQETGKPSQLNPLFVMEMMGFPPNWTVLPFQNGETNQSKP